MNQCRPEVIFRPAFFSRLSLSFAFRRHDTDKRKLSGRVVSKLMLDPGGYVRDASFTQPVFFAVQEEHSFASGDVVDVGPWMRVLWRVAGGFEGEVTHDMAVPPLVWADEDLFRRAFYAVHSDRSACHIFNVGNKHENLLALYRLPCHKKPLQTDAIKNHHSR